MKLHSLLLALLGVYACSAAYDPSTYVDRLCGEDLSNLWLDVVAVVDNSQGMTKDGLDNVAGDIFTVFSNGTRIGSDASNPRTTRLGLVTYNSVATQQADLNQYQSIGDAGNGIFDALSNTVDTTESYLATGLELAEKMLIDQSENTNRGHYKRVVIVYASEYKKDGELDPLNVANRLKLSGVNIITVAYQQSGDDGLLQGLSQIASPGFSFVSGDKQDGNLMGKVQNALLQSNCFCPSDWIQYRTSYSNSSSYHYGVCLQPVTISSNWLGAKMSCSHRLINSNLVTEFNQAKHDFILSVAKNTNGFAPPYQYHIGLNYASGSWVWAQPTGLQQVPLKQPSMWLPGYPQLASDKSAVMNVQSGLITGWQNIPTMTGSYNYFCETYSCDTDNYCFAQH